MKRILLFIATMFLTLSAFAAPVKKIIFFGDSLSDNGNLYHLLLKIIPRPPYYEGRFSNGPTWAENVGDYYKQADGIDYSIYAVAGATAEFHAPTTHFVTLSTLASQYYQYSLSAWRENKDDVLYSIWIGGNDYLFSQNEDLDTLTSEVVGNVGWLMNNLISQGAKYFLVVDVPDLSVTPFAREFNMVDRLHDASVMHNQKLSALVDELKAAHPGVNFVYVDAYSFLDDVVQNPDKYNQQYNINVKNTTESCWSGGFRLKASLLQETFKQELNKKLANKNNYFANNFLNNPEFSEAYAVSSAYQTGAAECTNPDEYLYWDHMHPTAIAHQILSKIVLDKLGALMS